MKRVKAKEVPTVDDALSGYAYTECRGLTHLWRPMKGPDIYDVAVVAGQSRYVQVQLCRKEHGGCGSKRLDIYDMSLRFVDSRYDYVDDYKIEGVKLTRTEAREWKLSRKPSRGRRLKSIKRAS